jgi:hypothetical protein
MNQSEYVIPFSTKSLAYVLKNGYTSNRRDATFNQLSQISITESKISFKDYFNDVVPQAIQTFITTNIYVVKR